MLKSVAKAFEFKETSISKGTLRLILILMVLSLPTWPIMIMDYYEMLPDNAFGTAALAVMLVGLISMLCFICTRFVNRFYFPDKYLDEWEIKVKHKSMTFAFMSMVWVLVPIAFFLMIGVGNISLTISSEDAGLWFVGFFLILLYLQAFHALWQVRPIDAE